jgi:hypothetical protein
LKAGLGGYRRWVSRQPPGSTNKKAGSRSRLFAGAEAYFFFISSGLDSLGEVGIGVVDGELLLELDAAPLPDMPLPDVPVPVEPLPDVLVSAPGAGVGVGAVVEGEDVEGAGALGAGAGGGVTTFSSLLLQAVRPTATRAAMRSERFMFFPLGEHHTG